MADSKTPGTRSFAVGHLFQGRETDGLPAEFYELFWSDISDALISGVRQGCPLSPYLFVLSVEVLANAIRLDPSIKGISVSQNEIKLSQYADDTTLILDGSQGTLETSLDVIEKFSKISGLRLNNKKTEALWIGSKARSSELLCPEKDFKWQELKIKTIGVWLSIQ